MNRSRAPSPGPTPGAAFPWRCFNTAIWLGLFAPAGTPPAIVARLNAEINKVLQQPEVREKIMAGGATPVGGTPEDFAAFVRKDFTQWGEVVKAADIKLSQ